MVDPPKVINDPSTTRARLS